MPVNGQGRKPEIRITSTFCLFWQKSPVHHLRFTTVHEVNLKCTSTRLPISPMHVPEHDRQTCTSIHISGHQYRLHKYISTRDCSGYSLCVVCMDVPTNIQHISSHFQSATTTVHKSCLKVLILTRPPWSQKKS